MELYARQRILSQWFRRGIRNLLFPYFFNATFLRKCFSGSGKTSANVWASVSVYISQIFTSLFTLFPTKTIDNKKFYSFVHLAAAK